MANVYDNPHKRLFWIGQMKSGATIAMPEDLCTGRMMFTNLAACPNGCAPVFNPDLEGFKWMDRFQSFLCMEGV